MNGEEKGYLTLEKVSATTPKRIGGIPPNDTGNSFRDARDVIIFKGLSSNLALSDAVPYIYSKEYSDKHVTWFLSALIYTNGQIVGLSCVNVGIDISYTYVTFPNGTRKKDSKGKDIIDQTFATASITDAWKCDFSTDLFPCSYNERKNYIKLGPTNSKLEAKYEELKAANQTVVTSYNSKKNTQFQTNTLDAGDSLVNVTTQTPLTTHVQIFTVYKSTTDFKDLNNRTWSDPTPTPTPTKTST
jgi:hypothetical protein